MHEAIALHLPAICVLCGEFGVKRLELFGSAMRTDFSLDRSDIDFLIEWHDGTAHLERWWGLLQALRVLLGRDVDLIDETSIRNWRLRRAIAAGARQVIVA